MMLSVSETFVKEAHAAACVEWQEKIEREFPQIFNTLMCRIKDTAEYKEYRRRSSSNCDVVKRNGKLFIDLPGANTEWTIAAWKLALKIMEIDKSIYPRHEEGYHRHIILQLP